MFGSPSIKTKNQEKYTDSEQLTSDQSSTDAWFCIEHDKHP